MSVSLVLKVIVNGACWECVSVFRIPHRNHLTRQGGTAIEALVQRCHWLGYIPETNINLAELVEMVCPQAGT